MLILFDHGTPRGISRALQGHIVKEARAQGWDTLNNGDLLKAAEEAGFDVLLTTDTNLPHQHASLVPETCLEFAGFASLIQDSIRQAKAR
jgi:hypothetical protein